MDAQVEKKLVENVGALLQQVLYLREEVGEVRGNQKALESKQDDFAACSQELLAISQELRELKESALKKSDFQDWQRERDNARFNTLLNALVTMITNVPWQLWAVLGLIMAIATGVISGEDVANIWKVLTGGDD